MKRFLSFGVPVWPIIITIVLFFVHFIGHVEELKLSSNYILIAEFISLFILFIGFLFVGKLIKNTTVVVLSSITLAVHILGGAGLYFMRNMQDAWLIGPVGIAQVFLVGVIMFVTVVAYVWILVLLKNMFHQAKNALIASLVFLAGFVALVIPPLGVALLFVSILSIPIYLVKLFRSVSLA